MKHASLDRAEGYGGQCCDLQQWIAHAIAELEHDSLFVGQQLPPHVPDS
jgi:hypothetical protein